MNLLGELTYLLVFVAGFIVIDRIMFGDHLAKLILDGWKLRLRRIRNRSSSKFPLQPTNRREILKTVDYKVGLVGRQGEVSPESQENGNLNDSFNDEKVRDPVVPIEDFDRIFADSRVEVIDTGDDVQEWLNPVLVEKEELDTEQGYDFPDDYGDDEDGGGADYDELDAALRLVTGQKQGAEEKDLALRAIRNQQGTDVFAGIEHSSDRIKDEIKRVIEDTFSDLYDDTKRSVEEFDMGEFM
jgi:hypothetical protein